MITIYSIKDESGNYMLNQDMFTGIMSELKRNEVLINMATMLIEKYGDKDDIIKYYHLKDMYNQCSERFIEQYNNLYRNGGK